MGERSESSADSIWRKARAPKNHKRDNGDHTDRRWRSKRSGTKLDESPLSVSTNPDAIPRDVQRGKGNKNGRSKSRWSPKSKPHDINKNLVEELQKQQGEIDALQEIIKTNSEPEKPESDVETERLHSHESPKKEFGAEVLIRDGIDVQWTEPDRGFSLGAKLVAGAMTLGAVGSYIFGSKVPIMAAAAFSSALALTDHFLVRALDSQKGMFTVTHEIHASKTDETELTDLRPDRQALKPIKHRPSYMKGEYIKKHLFMRVADIELNISAAAVAQIAVSANVALNANPQVAFERMNITANSLHTVNFDMYKTLYGQTLMQDSVLTSYGLYRQMHQRMRAFPFPSPPTI